MTAPYIIIGIHGLANKPPVDILRRYWLESITEGLQRNCNRRAGSEGIAFDIVYWANILHDQPISTEENDEPYLPAPGSGPLETYHDTWLDTHVGECEELADKPFDWALDYFGIDELGQEILQAKLRDLAIYYKDKQKRQQLRSIFSDAVKEHANQGKRIMVIAHSMGSIIAYDVLRALGRTEPKMVVDHFVTIGSPLGLPHVKYEIYKENDLIRTPTIVKCWSNFADLRDAVALDHCLSNDYRPNDGGVRVSDNLVINGYVGKSHRHNYHKAYGYLRAPEVSRVIRTFI